jgi:PASTA domain
MALHGRNDLWANRRRTAWWHMTGPDEPTRPSPAAESPEGRHPGAHAPPDIREEWDAQSTAEQTRAAVPPDATVERPVVRDRSHDDELPKRKVRGIARGVNIRADIAQEQEKLTFRIDRYDVGGNRLTPVPVEMRRYRGGIVTDGDEVEVTGRWSRGTLRATRIRNLTTSSEVRGWFAGWGKWVALAMLLLVAAAIALIGIFVLSSDSSPALVSVPNVVGRDEAGAANALRAADFSPKTTLQPDNAIPAGQVSATEPPAGVEVPKGSTVTLIVSSGPFVTPSTVSPPTAPVTQPTAPPTTAPPQVVIAGVTGMSGADATNQLRDQGLQVTVMQKPSDAVGFGVAIGTDPPEGTSVSRGSTVTLIISSGPSSTSTT